MAQFIDIIGQKFGRLTVLYRTKNNNDNHVQFLCQCECGKNKIIQGRNLRNGESKSYR